MFQRSASHKPIFTHRSDTLVVVPPIETMPIGQTVVDVKWLFFHVRLTLDALKLVVGLCLACACLLAFWMLYDRHLANQEHDQHIALERYRLETERGFDADQIVSRADIRP